MNDWFLQSIVWSIDSNGKDKVEFYINTNKVADFTLNNPLPALSIEIWLDSSLIDPEAPGGVTVSQPEEEQFMDIDFLSVVQPGI